ncbi:MAG TPA: cold shock domain-containing protein [Bacteroidales bacterium]|nr:cold shock domain-containing protein [Bacteroidales bacterium]
MGRSQETSNKKEVRNKKEKKRKDKEKKRELRKADGKKNTFDDMIAYADEFGRLSSVPSDPGSRIKVAAENIAIHSGRNRQSESESIDLQKKGVVISFNKSRGFGFIREIDTNKSFFVHIKNVAEPLKENDMVVFEIGKGSKGPIAMNVKIFRG